MMNDFEDKIRDSLRRADTVAIPVAPLDPEEIASRAPGPAPRLHAARGWLAAAAAIVLIASAGFGAWSWLGRTDTVPAAPAAVPHTSVEIDVFSGRENPRVQLDAATSRQLYAMFLDHEAAGLLKPAPVPEQELGFRGFIVTPADSTLPVLRILPTAVYVNRAGSSQRIDDPNKSFYTRIYDAIRPLIPDDVRTALPAIDPQTPNVTATIPPALGTPAVWVLAKPKSVSSTSTSLELKVTRIECASGKTGKILQPQVALGPDDIVIRTDASPLTSSAQTCQYNDSVTVTITLPEPIGNRILVDAACLEGQAFRGRHCLDHGIRWTP